jgi:hypothetical protein
MTAAPAINDQRYCSEETDRCAIIGCLRLARRILAAPALKKLVREEALPGTQVRSDETARLRATQRRNLLGAVQRRCHRQQTRRVSLDAEDMADFLALDDRHGNKIGGSLVASRPLL